MSSSDACTANALFVDGSQFGDRTTREATIGSFPGYLGLDSSTLPESVTKGILWDLWGTPLISIYSNAQ